MADESDEPSPQAEVIGDADALRERYGEPLRAAVACVKTSLDEHHRRFIAHSPFICIASSGSDGFPTLSPKGDAPGFVHVRDERTLVIPDRPGNNKIETFTNILSNPRVGLIFLIPGVKETLRVQGTAQIVDDEASRELGRFRGKLPRVALVVGVTRAYMHCGKSVVRSGLWDPSRYVEPGVIPSFGQMIRDQARLDTPAEQIQAALDKSYEDGLY